MRAPLLPITIAFLLGIWLAALVPCSLAGLMGLGLVSACIVCQRWLKRRWRWAALLALWLCLGALRLDVWRSHPAMRLAARLTEQPQPVRLHGIIRDDPVDFFGPHGRNGQTCILEVLHRRAETTWEPLSGRLRATIPFGMRRLLYGDEALIDGQWSAVPAVSNSGQYDWAAALARQRITGLLQVKPTDPVNRRITIFLRSVEEPR